MTDHHAGHGEAASKSGPRRHADDPTGRSLLTSELLQFASDYWFILLITIVLVLIRYEAGRRFGKSTIVTEASFVYGAYLFYYMARGLVKDQVTLGHANAREVINFERQIGLFIEPGLQQFAIRHEEIVNLMNWVYVWCHWPFLVGVLVWLFLKVPDEYAVYRNALLISGAIALVIFTLYPVAPPRFMPSFGFIDTIEQRSYSQHVLLPSGLANKYAAVPSLHAGWNLLMSIALFRHSRGAAAKTVAAVMPVLMLSSIVLTGNHYIIDGFIGHALAVLGLVLAIALGRRQTDQRQSELPETATVQS